MSKETPEFLNILLNLELQEYFKGRNVASSREDESGKLTVKRVLMEIAWRHAENDDLTMAKHIAQIINTPIADMMHEIGLERMIVNMGEKEINEILRIVGINKNDINQQILIRVATKRIVQGYAFRQLTGLSSLVSTQPDNQKIVDEINGLIKRGDSTSERRDEELLRLVMFLRKSVFTAE